MSDCFQISVVQPRALASVVARIGRKEDRGSDTSKTTKAVKRLNDYTYLCRVRTVQILDTEHSLPKIGIKRLIGIEANEAGELQRDRFSPQS
jgi:hypothetical protein